MTRKQKQRLSEIRQGAKQGTREGYRTPGGMNYTLAHGDVVELLKYIDHLESWVKDEAERHNVCTFDLLREVCDGCKCPRKGHVDAPWYLPQHSLHNAGSDAPGATEPKLK